MTTVETTTPALGRRTVVAMAVSVIGLAGAARAGPADLVDLRVLDRETGAPARVWRHDGRLFVAGRPGARYSLRVTNNTGGRVLVVMSVDGVNVLTGETAGYDQRGYVFSPYESYDVSGWRKSDTEVAAFTFASLSRSYAARTGRPGDVGVIGIAAFKERVAYPLAVSPAAESRSRRRDDNEEEVVVTEGRTAPTAAAPPPTARAESDRLAAAAPPPARIAPYEGVVTAQRRSERLGTAHGGREYSVVTSVPFERATRHPQLVRRIEYDSYANLAASGVIPPSWRIPQRPRPFPANPDGRGYVPDPPGGR